MAETVEIAANHSSRKATIACGWPCRVAYRGRDHGTVRRSSGAQMERESPRKWATPVLKVAA
jgi:hypothetical protein